MNDDIVLGLQHGYGGSTPFGLSAADRGRHLLAVGQTGSGKSSLLRSMVIQDILAGRGVAFLDPHGDDARSILDFVPPHRIDDVVYFDPGDSEFPIGFNLVGRVPPDERHLVASGVVTAFRSIWSESWGPRLEYILHAAVSALLECEHVSLIALPRMLSDDRFRAWVIRQVKDPMVRSFWTREFASYEKRFLQEAIAPLQNKVGQLLMSPLMRNIFGQIRSRFDARSIMDNRGIFIANLSKGRLGPDKTNLLGALCVTQFQQAAMSRADIPEADRVPFHMCVDEFASFTSDSFAAILSEARKYRLNLAIACQYLDQVAPKTLAAVLGNVGSIISFRVGPEDADLLAPAFSNVFAPRSFTALGNGEVHAKILVHGQSIEPFVGKTTLTDYHRFGRGEKIIQSSRERYATPRETVERKIAAWAARVDA